MLSGGPICRGSELCPDLPINEALFKVREDTGSF